MQIAEKERRNKNYRMRNDVPAPNNRDDDVQIWGSVCVPMPPRQHPLKCQFPGSIAICELNVPSSEHIDVDDDDDSIIVASHHGRQASVTKKSRGLNVIRRKINVFAQVSARLLC